MKTLSVLFACLGLGLGARAQTPPAETLGNLSRAAEQELATSIADLNALRDQIAAEKLPLAQELTAVEERVSGLRREHERVTRLSESGHLEIAELKQKLEQRKNDLEYVKLRLDEYARNFESRIGVGELQHSGKLIESAKQALENDTLSRGEVFTRQLALAERSLSRMVDAIGGMRFDGQAVDLQGNLLEGRFALLGPVTLFKAHNGVSGLVVPQSGSTNPLVRPLEGVFQNSVAALVEGGEGLLPFDPSRGGALKALVQKTSLFHIFEKGGPIMWPLLAASILALGTVLERLFFLINEARKRDRRALETFFAEVERGDTEAAVRTSKGSRFFVVRTLGYALEHKEQSLANALVYAQAQELKRFRRGVSILDTVITLAPLLGLLGTVTGMMGSFSLIGGDLSAPGAITGGIAEALIATAFGLGIAITALLPFNYLNTKIEEASHEIESASAQLELLVQPRSAPAAAPKPVRSGQPSTVLV